MQAARGTPVDDRDDVPDGPSGRSGGVLASPATWWRFAVLAVVLLVADQVTKVLAVRHLTDRREDVELVGEVLQLHLTYNPGAAFSIGGAHVTEALTVLAITATAVVLWLSRRLHDGVWATSLGFLLAGVVGNLLDRLLRSPGPFRGHVVDFLMLPNWPVFNVADICINVGVALALVQILRGIGLDGRKVDDPATKDSEAEQ